MTRRQALPHRLLMPDLTWDALSELWMAIGGLVEPFPPNLLDLLGPGAKELLWQARGEADYQERLRLQALLWERYNRLEQALKQ